MSGLRAEGEAQPFQASAVAWIRGSAPCSCARRPRPISGLPTARALASGSRCRLCAARRGPGRTSSRVPDGWITDIQTGPGDSIVGLKAARDLTRITLVGDDDDAGSPTLSIESSSLPAALSKAPLLSFWVVPNDPTIWLGGVNLVARADHGWEDGGSFQIPTISLNGAWLTTPVYQVRGASNNDRWAVGARYALRKTTP